MTMSECIKKEDAIEAMADACGRCGFGSPFECEMLARKVLNWIPPADVVQFRRGRWKKKEMAVLKDWGLDMLEIKTTWECSVCGHLENAQTNYCSKCGARMDAKE